MNEKTQTQTPESRPDQCREMLEKSCYLLPEDDMEKLDQALDSLGLISDLSGCRPGQITADGTALCGFADLIASRLKELRGCMVLRHPRHA